MPHTASVARGTCVGGGARDARLLRGRVRLRAETRRLARACWSVGEQGEGPVARTPSPSEWNRTVRIEAILLLKHAGVSVLSAGVVLEVHRCLLGHRTYIHIPYTPPCMPSSNDCMHDTMNTYDLAS